MKKKTILASLVIAALVSTCCGVLFAKAAFAAYANGRYTKNSCLTGGGYISVVSWSLTRVGDLAGGSQYGGGAWACDNPLDDRAIMFFAGSVTHGSGRYYTIDPDTEVDLTSTYNRTIAMGMVHNQTGSVYAVNIGYCLTSSCSSGKKAGGVISSFSSSVTRMNSSNQPHDYYGGWTAPYHTSGYAVINGVKLAEKWNSVEKTEIWDNFYRVTLYQYRCWSNNGTSATGTCSTNPIYLYVRLADNSWETTFSGKVTATADATYTNSSTATVTFTHSFTRNNNGPSDAVTGYWWSTNNSGTSWYNSGSPSYTPGNGWQTVNTNTQTFNLNYGDNTFCEHIGYYEKITDSGWDDWKMPSGCVTVHRYYWYEFDGRVVPKVNTTEKSDGSTTWIDGNTANLQFVHQLQRKTTASVQTRYKTSKNPTINNNFGIQTNWGDTSINVNNSWYTQRTSGSPNSVDIAKSDDGSTYCQTQNFWRYVRESVNWSDTNTYNTETTRSACVTLKRYKTNFTGGTTVTVNGTSYTNGQTVTITGDSVPTTATVVFNHKITRTSEDTPPAAPGDKHSTIAISTSGTTGCRSGDPCGNTVNEKNTTDLPRTGTDAQRSYTETQTINAKVYPDQTITICQQMTYTYRIWGSDYDKTSADQVCVTLHMAKATCSDGTTSQYGIHDGRNYASLTIFKNVNNGTDTSVASGIKDTGNHTITAWAMPGDNINFRHESCAAADLSNQFNSKGVSVSYDVSANKAGYLFGKSIGSSPYSATSANLGTTNSNPGTGPFSGGKYTITYRSPSISSPNNAGDMYSCSGKYGSSHGAKDNYYQITSDVANTASLRTATGLDNCKSYNYTVPSTSTEYAIGSNVGSTITQKIEWTDLWIQNDNAVNGHTGTGKASITADVKIPYNYYLHPYAQSAMGDSAVQTINPGGKLKANVYVPVMKRENTQVGSTYATHTKPTKIRVITFTMSSGEPKSAISYLNSNNGNETTSQLCAAAVSSGSAANCGLSNGDVSSTDSYVLNASTSGQFSGTASSTETGIGTASVRTNAISGTSTALISRDGSFVSSAEVTVPESSATVGDKVCIAVAAWPSDSHNLGAVKKVDNDNQNIALSQAIGSGSKWVVSAPTCATVAKYPSFSVEGSDLTVAGSVNTHISKYGGRNYVSWAEYSIRAGGTIVGTRMSSGAAGSYTATDNSIAINTGTTAPIYAESLKNINQANSAAGLTDSNPCRRTAQTYVRNGDCSSTSEAGHFSSVANEEGIKDLLERVRDVYTRKGATGVGTNDFSNLRWVEQITGYDYLNRPIKQTVDAYITIGSKKVYDLTPMNAYACDYDEDAGAYVPNAFDAERGIKADGTRVAPFYCLSNGSIYYHVSGDAYVGPKRDTIMTEYLNFVDDLVNNPEGQETYRNPTLIFHVDGKLTLDSNLVTDNYECASYNYQRVCTGWRAVDLFEDIQTIPQVIVIADQIDITANVSRVDAWLIADGNNYSTLNTCAYDNYSGFVNNNYIKAPNNSTTNGSSLSARKCNRPILFNGPVFAEKAILNRTAGGGTAAASWNTSNTSNLSLSVGQSNYAIRGEIFNLRSDVYLWGYYQAQRNGILTTVFSQELPTRY